MEDFFPKTQPTLGGHQLVHFFILFGVCKGLLVARLVHYQKSLNVKAIKCKVIELQLFELLSVW
jgi:hypothetical protein